MAVIRVGLLGLVLDWLAARRERLEARRQVQGYACELRQPEEPEVGFHGRPACYLTGDELAGWCEPCRARQVPYATMRQLLKEERLALQRVLRAGKWPQPAQAGRAGDVTTDVPYPFVRTTYTDRPDWQTERVQPAWRPGTEIEYEELHDSEGEAYAVAHGTGWMRVRELGRCALAASYRPRVFYTRQWVDPDGKVFGKSQLRFASEPAFASLLAGYRHPWRLVESDPAPVRYVPLREPSGSDSDADDDLPF